MSAGGDRSFGEELLRIIRAEIADYDRRKDNATRLRRAADEAVVKADRAAKDARVKNATGAEGFSDHLTAQAVDRLIGRQLQRAGQGKTTIVVNNSRATEDGTGTGRVRAPRRLFGWLRGRDATRGGAR